MRSGGSVPQKSVGVPGRERRFKNRCTDASTHARTTRPSKSRGGAPKTSAMSVLAGTSGGSAVGPSSPPSGAGPAASAAASGASPPTIGLNLRVTGYCNQGGRKYMEDVFSVAYQQTEDEKDLEYAFFGIFDGHGGREAAIFAKVSHISNVRH